MRVSTLEPGRLQLELMADGRWLLVRDLVVGIGDRVFRVPAGFDTDLSSWPWWSARPKASRMAVAGVVHDYAFRFATFGEGGDPIGFAEANRLWYVLTRAGDHPKARASFIGAATGFCGLWAGSWVTWLRYRNASSG